MSRENKNLSTSLELTENLFNIVTDPAIRSILFGVPLNATVQKAARRIVEGNIVSSMRRVINLAYLVAITRWKQVIEEGFEDNYLQTKQFFEEARFTRLFNSAVKNEEITLDLQVFSLIELWIGLKNAPRSISDYVNGLFWNFFYSENSDNIGVYLQKAKACIKTFDPSKFGQGEDDGASVIEYNHILFDLVESFAFLEDIEIVVPSQDDVGDFKNLQFIYYLSREHTVLYPNLFSKRAFFLLTYNQLCALNPALEKSEFGGSNVLEFYMITETTDFNGNYEFTYTSLDDERKYRVTRVIDGVNQEKEDEEELVVVKEVRKFLAFDYKNIRDFALIISDAIKSNDLVKRRIFDLCRKRYPRIIVEKTIPTDASRWDNIVTLLLVEMGQSEFLTKILNVEEDTLFKNIMNDIDLRMAIDHNHGKAKQDLDLDTDDKKNNSAYVEIQNYLKTKNTINTDDPVLKRRQIVELRVKYILKHIGYTEEVEEVENPFIESLTFKYRRINNYLEVIKNHEEYENEEVNDACQKLDETFRWIFIFLQVFYEGLDAYSLKFQERALWDENLPVSGPESRLGICTHAFKMRALSKLNDIAEKQKDATTAFGAFCDMCAEYNPFSYRDSTGSNQRAKNLKKIITRGYICDVEKLKLFATLDLCDSNDNNKKLYIFDILKNYSSQTYIANYEKYCDYLDQFKDLFFFLIYNEDYNNKGLFKSDKKLEDKDCDPVYPYLVDYYKQNVDREQIKKCMYRVPIPTDFGESNRRQSRRNEEEDEEGLTVTLLTNEEYSGKEFFCIPLRYGSSDSWWINPFLIGVPPVRDIYREYINEHNKANAGEKN